MKIYSKILLVLGVITSPCSSIFAQDSIQEIYQEKIIIDNPYKSEWKFKLEPNMLMPRLTGNVGAGEFNVPNMGLYQPELHVEQSPSEFVKRLKIGSMIAVEAYNDNWAINGDFSYFVLQQNVGNHSILKDAKINVSQFFGDVTVFRRLTPWLEVGLGANVISANTKIDADIYNIKSQDNSVYNLYVDKTRNWVDPMVAARIANKPDARFLYMARGDIGGFGVSSKLAWQTIAQVGYRFNKTIYGIVGYRYISIDYLKGSGLDRYKYDIHISGPMLKLGFNIP
jgi:hypothetical protein